jgi:hypothetical protein
VTGFCEHGNEHSGSIRRRILLLLRLSFREVGGGAL